MSLRALASLSLLALAPVTAIVLSGTADGRQLEMAMPMDDHFFGGAFVPEFALQDMPLGGITAPTSGPHPGSHGSTLVADGRGLLVLDRDSGELVRTDRSGTALGRLAFHSDAGELVWNGHDRVYVADRTDDRVAVVAVGDASGKGLKVLDGVKIREPHGLALTPDGATLLVTSVADQQLVAVDTQTLAVRWRLDLAQEPRSVAVSADGKQALIGFLSTGAVAFVDLAASEPSSSWLALDPALPSTIDPFSGQPVVNHFGMPAASGENEQDVGRRFARNAFAVGYIGDGLAVVPHQLSTPHLPASGGEDLGTYGGGGGFLAPITHRVAWVDAENAFAPDTAFAEIGLHQPRALAYDLASDTLYLAGYGDDRVFALGDASQSSIHLAWSASVAQAGTCAPDGIAFEGTQVWVHCELGRHVVSIDGASAATTFAPATIASAELAATTRSAAERRGADIFRRGRDHRVSTGGFMACASCHPEGRSDGLSWRIEGHNLQTPLLAGRLLGTHPYKWDGKDADLPTSLRNTVGRLGGSGLSQSEANDLQAFLEGLPKPKTPTIDKAARARGQAIFESEEAACSACHQGDKLADGQQYDFATNLVQVDTPSLVGLAYSAPYYHDGSARTLRALLTDKASIHGMGNSSQLDDAQLDDLIAYLESL
jgi:mono/diheme cytochrome c family protein